MSNGEPTQLLKPPPPEGWAHYERLVLAHLGRHETAMQALDEKIEDLKRGSVAQSVLLDRVENVHLKHVEETLAAHLAMHREFRTQTANLAQANEHRLTLIESGAVRNSGMAGALMSAVVYVVMFFVGKLWRI